MPWKPEHPGELPSLGWVLLDWWADYLPNPRDETKPLIFTDEQAQILLRWYTIDPKTGGYVYRRGCSRRSKGWGKSPVEAAKCIAEFVGPVRFDGWDADGKPVGRPWGYSGDPAPWVQVAAVSEDQTDNTYGALRPMIDEGPLAEVIPRTGEEFIRLPGGGPPGNPEQVRGPGPWPLAPDRGEDPGGVPARRGGHLPLQQPARHAAAWL